MILSPSPNFDAREAAIDMLVLHYTGMRDAAAALARLTDPAAKVSAHYLVDEDGEVYRLVEEDCRAWHAGESFWRGVARLNGSSIGIEIVNPGHEWGYRPFPAPQMAAVTGLCLEILGRHAIAARNVVGHSDIAPSRKQDPGELFGWRGLAQAGVGVWTDDVCAGGDLWADLAAIGYDVSRPTGEVVLAFQRHFLPEHLTGEADAQTAGRAAALRRILDAAGEII